MLLSLRQFFRLLLLPFCFLSVTLFLIRYLAEPYATEGAYYDLASNQWTTISTKNAPRGRERYLVGWDGQDVVFWGGYKTPHSKTPEPTKCFHLQTNTWTTLEADVSKTIQGHNACFWQKGMFVLDPRVPVLKENHWSWIQKGEKILYPQDIYWTGSALLLCGYGDTSLYFAEKKEWEQIESPYLQRGRVLYLQNKLIVVENSTKIQYHPRLQKYITRNDFFVGKVFVYHFPLKQWISLQFPETFSDAINVSPLYKNFHILSAGSKLIFWHLGLDIGQIYDFETKHWVAVDTPQDFPPPIYGTEGYSVLASESQLLFWNRGESWGRIYSLQNKTWSVMNMEKSPSFLPSADLLWTGSQLLVWGGHRYSGVYDIESNQWRSISSHKAPNFRDGVALFWTGETLILWGGEKEWFISNPFWEILWANLVGLLWLCLDTFFIFLKKIKTQQLSRKRSAVGYALYTILLGTLFILFAFFTKNLLLQEFQRGGPSFDLSEPIAIGVMILLLFLANLLNGLTLIIHYFYIKKKVLGNNKNK